MHASIKTHNKLVDKNYLSPIFFRMERIAIAISTITRLTYRRMSMAHS